MKNKMRVTKIYTLEEIEKLQESGDYYSLEYELGESDGIIDKGNGKTRFLVVATKEEAFKLEEKIKEDLKKETKFKALIRNTEKKEITENEIFLEYNESSEEINITVHDMREYTDEFYYDVKIACSGQEDENEIMQYLTDHWESENLSFEFFFIPEIPALVKFGGQEYLVYTMREKGLNYKEISQVLKIAESTVRDHYRNALRKMTETKIEQLTELEKEVFEYYDTADEVKSKDIQAMANKYDVSQDHVRNVFRMYSKADRKTTKK